MYLKKSEYDTWINNNDTLFLPEVILTQIYGQSSPEERINFHNYDSFGNPLYLTKKDTEKTCYLWGYGKRYPVAKIEGLTYVQIANFFSDNSISSLSNATGNDVINLLSKLRSDLASQDALITTFTYKPFVGILTETDPRGLTTTYDYDTQNRLVCIKDPNGKILKKYEYHYAQ